MNNLTLTVQPLKTKATYEEELSKRYSLSVQDSLEEDQGVKWKPLPPTDKHIAEHRLNPQSVALTRQEYETLYGGARGPGKTDAGIVWLLRDHKHPLLRALIIRKNSTDLTDWIDRAKRMYAHLGVKVKGNPAQFHFPSGAIFYTGHLKDKEAYTKYLGHEYQRMLIEELTLIATEKSYMQLISACRTTIPDLPARIFATTNPGSIGHLWVKNRFVLPAKGKTYYDPISGRSRIFIAGNIEDNPILNLIDPGYIKFLDSLPENLRKAWREGSWDIIAGQVFNNWCEDHIIEPFKIPKDWKRYAAIDWGSNNPLSIAWYAEDYDGRTYKYRESYFGVQGEIAAADDFLARTKLEFSDENIAIYMRRVMNEAYEDIVYCTADPAMFSPKTHNRGPSIAEEMAEDHTDPDTGKKLDGITMKRGQNDRANGLERVRAVLSRAPDGKPWFQVFKTCHNHIRTYPALAYDEVKTEDVDTDLEDHCLLFDTNITTRNGVQSIGNLVGTRGDVLTTGGRWVRYHTVRKTRKQQPVLEIVFTNGTSLSCTPDHKIRTMTGEMVEAQHILEKSCYRLLSYRKLAKSFWENAITCVESIFQDTQKKSEVESSYTGLYGNTIFRRLRGAGIFIIKTAVDRTTTLRIWLACQWVSTYQNMPNKQITLSGLKQCTREQESGMDQQQAESGIKSNTRTSSISFILRGILSVSSATLLFILLRLTVGFANLHVKLSGVGTLASTILKRIVQSVKRYFQLVSMIVRPLARGYVVLPLGVRSVKKKQVSDVYCLVADETHVFALENGVVVSNCYDMDRYHFMSRPFAPAKAKPKTPAETEGTFEQHLKKMRNKRLSAQADVL